MVMIATTQATAKIGEETPALRPVTIAMAQTVALCAGQEDHAAALRSVTLASGSTVSSAGKCDSSQSAAFAEELGGKTMELSPLSGDYIENLKAMAALMAEVMQ